MENRTLSFVNIAVVNLNTMNVNTVANHAVQFSLIYNKIFPKMTKDKQNTHA